MNSKINWKKGFRKLPDKIIRKLDELNSEDVIVAGVKKIPVEHIVKGKYRHLDISLEEGEVRAPKAFTPKDNTGKQSRLNINGKEIKRKDLPMITKTYTWEVPNYGDWSNGSHEASIDREVYQTEFIAPKNLQIKIDILGKEVKNSTDMYVFKFSLSEVLNKKQEGFEDDLLFNVNLLQENTGVSDVFESTASHADYLKTVYLSWEILPKGSKDEVIDRILSGVNTTNPLLREKLTQRYDLLSKLKPANYIQGTSGFQRYFGAQFSDKLVVFENIEYGNAIYVMFEKWDELSKLSRLELLKNRTDDFVRIIHRDGWENVLKQTIQEKLKAS